MICWLRHLWIKLNYCGNYGDWESKVEYLVCHTCGTHVMKSRRIPSYARSRLEENSGEGGEVGAYVKN